jgi:hypothetical protein
VGAQEDWLRDEVRGEMNLNVKQRENSVSVLPVLTSLFLESLAGVQCTLWLGLPRGWQ